MASYVNKEDLAKWIRDKQSLQIIDVRDDDCTACVFFLSNV